LRKHGIIVCGILASVVALALYCTNPQNPFSNPKSAKIVADSSLTSLKDSMQAFTTVPCTVSLYLPDLFDSFFVVRRIGTGTDSVIASGTVSSSQVAFSLPVTYPGIYTLNIRIVKTDKTEDSLTRTFTVYAPYTMQVGFILPQKDSLLFHREYACSCSVTHPELADSLVARLIYAGADTVLIRTKAAAVLAFRFTVPVIGAFSICVSAPLLGGGQDSVKKECTGFVRIPVVTPDSVAFHVTLPLDSFTFKFTAAGPDSNLRFGYTWVDTAIGQTQTTPFPALKPFHESISRTVKGDVLLSGLKAPIVCHAYAIDANSLFSAVASCTLYVTDTLAPVITLLSLDTNKEYVNTDLPLTLKALVTDIAGLNSVAFNGAVMTVNSDTSSFLISSLDTGKHIDSIVAVDKAGNKGRLFFALTYHGKQLYRPELKDLSRATTEGHPFATIYLDTCIIIKDPAIVNKLGFARDSITWEIRDSSGQKLNYDQSTHLFTVPFPADTEWAGTIKLDFKAWITNSPTLYDAKQPSFFIAEVYDPPVITFPQNLCSTVPHSDTIYLDTVTTVRALDNKLSLLDWTFKAGKHFKVDSLYRNILGLSKTAGLPVTPIGGGGIIPIKGYIFNRHVVISPIAVADTGYSGADTLQFSVKSPQGNTVIKPIYFSHSKFCGIRILP
jgi:hypothetical protein